jgi:hypothetical protein
MERESGRLARRPAGVLPRQPSASAVGRRAPKVPGEGEQRPVCAREQARKAGIQADLAQLDLDRQRGLLISVDKVKRP